jgi:hypothetical protein
VSTVLLAQKEKKLNLSVALEYALLVHRNLLEYTVVKAMLKYNWRVLNLILKKSLISIISPICFQLNRGENGIYNIPSKYHTI